jgi:hypothetical protein
LRQEELEAFLAAEPATSWSELAAKARYLIELFAATAEGQDARRQKLIKTVLDEFARMAH